MTGHDELAQIAIAPIRSGMVVGLGTGRAASRGIRALAEKARQESLSITCVATSLASDDLAKGLGLTVRPMREVSHVDYLFDGADEVDPRLHMLKGGGGAMTREKIVAHAADRRAYMVQRDKMVERLGVRTPLPVEVLHYALSWVQASCEGRGLRGEIRVSGGRDGQEPGKERCQFVTDNSNAVLDLWIPAGADIVALASWLDATPGVVGHGLFISEADVVYVEDPSGAVATYKR